jgi:hypothetical protein
MKTPITTDNELATLVTQEKIVERRIIQILEKALSIEASKSYHEHCARIGVKRPPLSTPGEPAIKIELAAEFGFEAKYDLGIKADLKFRDTFNLPWGTGFAWGGNEMNTDTQTKTDPLNILELLELLPDEVFKPERWIPKETLELMMRRAALKGIMVAVAPSVFGASD